MQPHCRLTVIASVLLALMVPESGQGQTPILRLAPVYPWVVEGRDTVATVQVWRLGDTNGAVSVDYVTAPALYGPATPGLDYEAAAGTLLFAPGETNRTVQVAILSDDVLFEGVESFEVRLANPSPGAALGATVSAFVAIEDKTWPSFYDGTFALEKSLDDDVLALAGLPDGGFLAGGAFRGFGAVWIPGDYRESGGVARLHQDGSIDTRFSPGSGANGLVYAVAVESAGTVLMGGAFTAVGGVPRPYLARLRGDGSLDPTFAPVVNNELRAIVVQPDGRILVGGRFTMVNGQARGRMARLHPDGSLDESFQPGTGADRNVRALALQPDGRIVVVGNFAAVNGVSAGGFARLLADGSVDTGFASGPGANDEVRAIAVQPDGRILLGGEFDTVHGTARARVARLNGDGSVDTSFNPGAGVDGVVRALTVQPDNRILVGGGFGLVDGRVRRNFARLNSDGTVDDRFPGRSLDPLVGSFDDEVFAMLVQPNGSILVGGQFLGTNVAARTGLNRVHGDATVPGFVLGALHGFALETEPAVTISIRRLGDLSGSAEVEVATIPGSALPGEDYVAAMGALHFEPGEFEKSLTVSVLNDDRREPDESLEVRLGAPLHGAVLGTPVSQNIFVFDNDTGFDLEQPNMIFRESAGEVTVTVTRGPDALGAATVDYATEDGTAQAGMDYEPTAGTLEFAAGETRKSFVVRLLADAVVEGTEHLGLRLSRPTGGTSLGRYSSTGLYFQDAGGSPGFLYPTAQVSEGGGSVTLQVVRSYSGVGTISIRYATRDGSARAGSDYGATSGVLTFEDGEFLKGVTIPILDDAESETNETFEVVLSQPSTGAGIGDPAVARVTIVSNDRGFGLAATQLSILERVTNLAVTVFRDGSETGPAGVGYQTEAGTAEAGPDFLSSAGTIQFGAGESVRTILIPVVSDCMIEPTEQFSVRLLDPPPPLVLGPSRLLTVSILDDDRDQWLEILAIRRDPAGATHLSLAYPEVFGCVVEASTDLSQWIPLATNLTSQCGWDFTDRTQALAGRRFYRARLHPLP